MIIPGHFLIQSGGKRKEVRPRAGSVAGRAWQVEEAACEAGLREGV